jgi:hypothetical protein
MTNQEALLRLSVNKHDLLAVSSLRDNNPTIIRSAMVRYFGTAPVEGNVESALMKRLADHARLYDLSEDPEAWLVRCATVECDRLRNEAIRKKADND